MNSTEVQKFEETLAEARTILARRETVLKAIDTINDGQTNILICLDLHGSVTVYSSESPLILLGGSARPILQQVKGTEALNVPTLTDGVLEIIQAEVKELEAKLASLPGLALQSPPETKPAEKPIEVSSAQDDYQDHSPGPKSY